jgi:hypothetical protein
VTTVVQATLTGAETALQTGNVDYAIYLYYGLMGQFQRLCGQDQTSVTKLHLLRVGTDGASTDVVAQQWSGTTTTVYTVVAGGDPSYHTAVTETGYETASVDVAKMCEEGRGGGSVSRGRPTKSGGMPERERRSAPVLTVTCYLTGSYFMSRILPTSAP